MSNALTTCPPSNWWMLPELVGLNRLPAQATTYPYPDEESAAKHQRESSPWYLPLDGRWRFRLMPNPRHEDAPLADAALDDGDWAGIEVPGCWTMQGFDPPIYLNVRMPFDNLAPEVPQDDNPTGWYRRKFSVPAGWRGRRNVLHFGGVKGAYLAYVNGRLAGMAKDARLPAEFDVTMGRRDGPRQ